MDRGANPLGVLKICRSEPLLPFFFFFSSRLLVSSLRCGSRACEAPHPAFLLAAPAKVFGTGCCFRQSSVARVSGREGLDARLIPSRDTGCRCSRSPPWRLGGARTLPHLPRVARSSQVVFFSVAEDEREGMSDGQYSAIRILCQPRTTSARYMLS